MTDILELAAGPSAILITEDGGVKKEVLVDGKGDLPDKFARCLVHYRAWLAENGEVFMETKKETSNSEPVTLVAGRDTSFRDVGINLAVATMRVGEVARVFVHPKYGYGEKGSFSFPTVPPNADLVYELELLAFENTNQEKPVGSMLYEERLEAAEQRRMEGNELYAQSDFAGCLAKYVLGLNYFSEDFMMQLEGTFYDQANEIRTRLLLNMAAVKLKLEAYHDAASCCTEVLKHDKASVKAWYRRARARMALGNAEDAEEDLKTALGLAPGDKATQIALVECVRMKAADREASKKLFKGKFGKGGLFGDEPAGSQGESASMEDSNAAQPPKGLVASLVAWLLALVHSLFALVGLAKKTKTE